MKIKNMTIEQIEEYIRENFPDTNLFMRCLICDEYYPLNEMDLKKEFCQVCSDDEET